VGQHIAVRVRLDGWTCLVDGVIEEVVPHFFVDEGPVCVFASTSAGDDPAVGTFGIVFHVEIGDEAPRVAEGRMGGFDVYEWAKLLKTKELPRAAIVIGGPPSVEDVGETEEAIKRRCGRE
jgi:hypothetical protein